MAEAYLIDAVRTPTGKRDGGLSQVHPHDMAAVPLKALFERNDVDPGAVEDNIMGCCDTIGPQSGDIARLAWLAAGLPVHVPGVTIDRQCGSSQQAIHFAAQGVMSGTQDLVVCSGVQNMSRIPISSAMVVAEAYGYPTPFTGSQGWAARYGDEEVSQFRGADMIAKKWDISREQMEAYALESHARAARARDEGRFDREIIPVGDVRHDEGIRTGSTPEKLAGLKLLPGTERMTAAVSSQISDAATACLIASERAVKEHGLTPKARIHHLSVLADDPIMMLSAPIPATKAALKRAGMTMDDIDLVEINEAFASVVQAWMKDLDVDHAKVNVNGGGIALGHPIGATGIRLMSTLVHELERTGKRWGLQTMCEGGGQANVTIIERLG